MRRFIACLLLSSASLLSGCYASARGRVEYRAHVSTDFEAPRRLVIASAPPPVLREIEVRPAAPMAHAIWVAGHYEWHGHWQWIPGYWESARPGYVWMAPVAHHQGARIVYYGGYWRRVSRPAPAVYLRPGAFQLTVQPRAAVVARPQPVIATPPRVEAHGGLVVRPAPAIPPTRTVIRPAPTPHGAIVIRPSITAPRPVSTTPRASVQIVPSARTTITPAIRPAIVTPAPIRPVSPIVARPAPAQVSVSTTLSVNGRRTAAVMPAGQAGQAPVLSAGRGTAAETPPGLLTCQLDSVRAPANGIITVNGTGFGAGTSVMVGANRAVIVARNAHQLRARLSGSFGGGEVKLLDGGRQARCGALTIIGR